MPRLVSLSRLGICNKTRTQNSAAKPEFKTLQYFTMGDYKVHTGGGSVGIAKRGGLPQMSPAGL